MGLVTCRKCKKVFDFDKYMGVCPKCCRYHSKTSYDEDLIYEENILSSADSSRCSYHGEHSYDKYSGHDENSHIKSYSPEYRTIQSQSQNNIDIEQQKRDIEQKLRTKYANGTTPNIDIPKRYNLYEEQTQMTKKEYQKREKKINVWIIVFLIYILIQFLSCFVSLFE